MIQVVERLVYHPDEGLRETAAAIDTFDAPLRELVRSMIATMQAARGIGLAGPQVGQGRRLFVVQVPENEPIVFVNPRIVAASPDETKYEEGCLSIPGVYADVTRPTAVTVVAQDASGTEFRLDAEGLLARVIQHEADHLNGVLFIDYLPRRRRERLLADYQPPNTANGAH